MARFRLFITVNGMDEQQNKPLGLKVDYGIEYHFKVDNFQDMLHQTPDGDIEIDQELGVTLLSIAYSTSRGIILERTQGTFFEGVILPVIDPFKVLFPIPEVEV